MTDTTREAVERLDPDIARGSNPDYDDAVMVVSSNGGFVAYADYAAIRAAKEAAESERDAAVFALRDVVAEYPVAAGTAKLIPPDEQGYGSIYRARQFLATLDQPKENNDDQ